MPFDRPALPVDRDKLLSLWADLASKDAGRAFDAIGLLIASPMQAVPMLKGKLHPAPETAERRHVIQLINGLDSEEFVTREKAMEQLRQLGERAEPALEEALQGKPTLEARKRIEELLDQIRTSAASPQRLRELRGLEVLEQIGTADARQVLKFLADGAPHARLTRESRKALGRLMKRDAPKP